MKNSIDFYLSKGLDQRTAEYFSSGRRKILNVIPNDDYTLTLEFDNGERRLYNVAPLIQKNTVFEALSDKELFSRAYIDEQHAVAWDIDPSVDSNLIWNNKIDLCPDSCYLDSVSIVSTSV
ncbi:MAG: DUF2442 domain-containing protein [Lachnospiraceae bacterium]|nr:DUF2442 domain-containing protein [Lachnospiraceae bacterium]